MVREKFRDKYKKVNAIVVISVIIISFIVIVITVGNYSYNLAVIDAKKYENKKENNNIEILSKCLKDGDIMYHIQLDYKNRGLKGTELIIIKDPSQFDIVYGVIRNGENMKVENICD